MNSYYNDNEEMEILIRRFRKDDAESVAKLIRRALFEVNSKDYPLDELQRIAQGYTAEKLKKITQSKTIFVAEDERKVVGTATIEGGHITCVFVLPAYLRKGVGKQLMQIVEDYALAHGVTQVKLESSLTAYTFYKQRGYENQDGEDTVDKRSIIHMYKDLVTL